MDNNAVTFFVGFTLTIGIVVLLIELAVMCVASLLSRKERNMSFKKQVEAGAKLLDEKIPGWENKIYLDNFDIAHTCRCVIGQLYGAESNTQYWSRLDALFPGQNAIQESYAHGFGTSGNMSEDLAQLTDEWKSYIQKRRSHVSTH